MTDVISKHRIFPRLFALFYVFLTWDVWQWVKLTPELSEYQHYFAMAIVAGAVGYFKYYVETGND